MPRGPKRAGVYPDALVPGTRVGPWRVVERLSVGGQGAVYRVEDAARRGVFRVLKLWLEAGDERAEREAELMRRVGEHPNVVRFHGCLRWPDSPDGFTGLLLDWVPHQPLDTWTETVNPTFRELARRAGKVALTVGALHAKGILHRDLKPEHILIREPDGEPVLVDLGAGWCEGVPTLTLGPLPLGTLYVRSPEALRFYWENLLTPGVRSHLSRSDDLYALGVCLYRAVTGHFPFPAGAPMDVLQRNILHQRPYAPVELNPRVPRALDALILRLLEKNPEARPASGEALHEALEAAAREEPEAWEARVFEWDGKERRTRLPEWPIKPWVPSSSWEEEAAPPRRRSRPWGLLGVVCMLGLGGLTTWLREELARAPESSEAGRAAVPPPVESTPAAVASATCSEEVTPVKKPQQNAEPRKGAGPSVAGLCFSVATSTWVACATTPASVRPLPEDCPPTVYESMQHELDLMSYSQIGGGEIAVFDQGEARRIPVREGDTTLLLESPWGRLPAQTVLAGRLFFEGKRIHGRFREARLPGGKTLPVCLELWQEGKRGAEMEPGSGKDTAMIFSVVDVRPVRRFE